MRPEALRLLQKVAPSENKCQALRALQAFLATWISFVRKVQLPFSSFPRRWHKLSPQKLAQVKYMSIAT